MACCRFKHGGRGWNNPFKKREGERLTRGNRGDLKTPEQVGMRVQVVVYLTNSTLQVRKQRRDVAKRVAKGGVAKGSKRGAGKGGKRGKK